MRLGSACVTCLSIVLAGCASMPSAGSSEAPPVNHPYDVAVVHLPELSGSEQTPRKPLERSLIGAGVYTAHVSLSNHHGCSQSWASSSLTGTIKLETDGRRVALELDLDRSSASGSRHAAGASRREAYKLAGTWEGTVEPTEHHAQGAFRARLAPRSCGERCVSTGGPEIAPSEPFEIVCERERIQLTEPEDPGGRVGGPPRPSGGVLGIVCRGLESAIVGTEYGAFPMAPGAGLALSSDGYGGDLRVSFAQPPATR